MIKCSSRIIARSTALPPPPVCPLLGSGASVGPIRRIPAVVATLVGCTVVALPPLLYYNLPPNTQPVPSVVVVPEPSGLALYALAVALLMFIHAMRRTRHA